MCILTCREMGNLLLKKRLLSFVLDPPRSLGGNGISPWRFLKVIAGVSCSSCFGSTCNIDRVSFLHHQLHELIVYH